MLSIGNYFLLYLCMIIDENKNVILASPSDYNKLNVSTKNYIYDKLFRGLLLFYIPDKLKDEDRTIKNSYKAGFLDELLKEVYDEEVMNVANRYKVISEKYHLFYTPRMFNSLFKNYKKLCI